MPELAGFVLLLYAAHRGTMELIYYMDDLIPGAGFCILAASFAIPAWFAN